MNNDLRPINTIPNFKRFCMTIGELPTSYLETMTYYEMLVWFTEYMKNTIIPTINNNGLAIEELQDKYIELKSYVDNYFTNLDVQQEINNKLDAMAQSGQLTDIIAQYLGLAGMLVFNNVNDMKQATNLVNGSSCQTLGFHTVGDKGNAFYKVRNITNEDTIDEMTIIALNNPLLIAELVIEDEMNVKQFGAYGDYNSHLVNGIEQDTLSIQKAIDKINGKVIIPNGTYLINTLISNNNTNRIYLSGESKLNTTLKYNIEPDNDTSILLLASNTSRNIIENINFSSNYNSQSIEDYENYHINGITSDHSSYNIIRNCRFFQLKNGIKLEWSWTNNIEDCYMGRCNIGINGSSSAINDIYIKMCQIEYNNYGVYLGEGRNQSLYNCDIEKNKTFGLEKTNEGDIQLINCYFEDKLNIRYGQTYVSNILILGCSFFQAPNSLNEAYTPITYHGDKDYTKISIINCNFKILSNDETTYNTPAIKQLSNNGTINPTLINNSCHNMIEFETQYFHGIRINNGKIEDYLNRSFYNNFINTSDGSNKDLLIDGPFQYRVNIGASGSSTITLPLVPENLRYLPIKYEFIVTGNISNSNANICTITPLTGANIYGSDKTISISDKDKLVSCIYVGYFNNQDNWEVIK